MQDDIVVVADHHSWLRAWTGPVLNFEDATVSNLKNFSIVVLAPGGSDYIDRCSRIIDWKRQGDLNDTKLILGTYVGRHIWNKQNDHLVERWVVHGRSERSVLESDRLAYLPICLMPPRRPYPQGDDGYVFLGGRKWRELGVGIEAIHSAGFPGRVISDLAPPGDYPNIDIKRERIPKDQYSAVMARARLVLVPLKITPVSHGHVDVVTAISLGKPVLVTRGCSCDDYIKHGVNGLLVDDNNVETWSKAIKKAWLDADRMADAARQLAPQYHAHRYAEYLRDLCRLDPNDLIQK